MFGQNPRNVLDLYRNEQGSLNISGSFNVTYFQHAQRLKGSNKELTALDYRIMLAAFLEASEDPTESLKNRAEALRNVGQLYQQFSYGNPQYNQLAITFYKNAFQMGDMLAIDLLQNLNPNEASTARQQKAEEEKRIAEAIQKAQEEKRIAEEIQNSQKIKYIAEVGQEAQGSINVGVKEKPQKTKQKKSKVP